MLSILYMLSYSGVVAINYYYYYYYYYYNLCVTHFDLHNFFLFKPYFSFVFGPVVFALQWLPNFNHLGTSALETFGPYLPFLTFTACLEMI